MKIWTLLLALPISMTAAAEPSYGGYSGHGGMTAYDIAPNVYEYHYDHGFTGEDTMGWKPELQFIWSRFGAAEACGLPYDSEAALAALQQKYGHDRFVHEINGISFHAAQAKANANFCTSKRVQQLKRELSEINSRLKLK